MSSSREKLLDQFRQLVIERSGRVTRELTILDRSGVNEDSRRAGQSSLRDLHGLKGEARMMGFAEMNELIHAMEEVLKQSEPVDFRLPSTAVDALMVCCDSLQVMAGAQAGPPPDVLALLKWLGSVSAQVTPQSAPMAPVPNVIPPTTNESLVEPEMAAPAQAVQFKTENALKFSAEQLNELSDGIGSVFQRLRSRDALEVQRRGVVREMKALARMAEGLGATALPLVQKVAQLRDHCAELNRQSLLLVSADSLELTQLQNELAQVRLSSVSVLFEMVPRLVRGLARELNREVEVQLDGQETRVDRNVLEALREPLIHLIRNAIDHGVEEPSVRAKAGKPPQAMIKLMAQRVGDRLVLSVSDDGQGLLREVIFARAVRSKLVSANAKLEDASVYELLFRSGFSTKDVVTDVSGRGVGLDAVRTAIQGLGGEVEVQSEPGLGTTFVLRVPVSLSASSVVFVRSGSEEVGFATAQVLRAITVEKNEISQVAGRPTLSLTDGAYPFASLKFLLGNEAARPARQDELVLLLKGRNQWAAIGVDALLEERMQPLIPIKGLLQNMALVAGAALRIDGMLRLVLSVPEVVLAVCAGKAFVASTGVSIRKKLRALVVDDSPLTRELLVSMMSSAGFEVLDAIDGLGALNMLKQESVEIVVSDLEMPHLNGIELTRAIKSDSNLRHIPVVLVTTRGSNEDKQKGLLAGAGAYITKSETVRRDLLDAVNMLLG